jgi:hypothetical protein
MSKPLIKLLSLLLFSAGVWAGFFSSSFAAPADPRPAGREKVYLLRGFLNVFSLGMDQLAEELRRKNVSATVANHLASTSLLSDAIAECKSGQISSIVIVGHSLGATAAVGMADELQKAGIRVALVMTLDPVFTTAVPRNVQRLKNFYFSDGVGKTVQPGEHFHGSLQNVDLKGKPELGHISLATSPAVHKQMLEYIASAASTRCR